MDNIMAWVWLGLVVLFVILEAVTSELVAIWFVAGSLTAFVCALLDARLWLQITLFIVVSGAVLLLVRPLVIKKARTEMVPTNSDMLLGKVGIVINEINNDLNVGRVEISGLDWAAVSRDGQNIKKGKKVLVHKIEGVKLIVTPEEKEK